MNMVVNYASGKPQSTLHGYSCFQNSKLQQPNKIMAMMHTMLLVKLQCMAVCI